MGKQGKRKKLSAVERAKVQATQPKKIRIIDGLKGGKGRMVIVDVKEP